MFHCFGANVKCYALSRSQRFTYKSHRTQRPFRVHVQKSMNFADKFRHWRSTWIHKRTWWVCLLIAIDIFNRVFLILWLHYLYYFEYNILIFSEWSLLKLLGSLGFVFRKDHWRPLCGTQKCATTWRSRALTLSSCNWRLSSQICATTSSNRRRSTRLWWTWKWSWRQKLPPTGDFWMAETSSKFFFEKHIKIFHSSSPFV